MASFGGDVEGLAKARPRRLATLCMTMAYDRNGFVSQKGGHAFARRLAESWHRQAGWLRFAAMAKPRARIAVPGRIAFAARGCASIVEGSAVYLKSPVEVARWNCPAVFT